MSEQNNTGPGIGQGGGEQFEQLEGSLTDGGSLPGKRDEDRSFGAGRQAAADGASDAQQVNGDAADVREAQSGQAASDHPHSDQADTPDAGPSAEQSGYGNTPPRE